MKKTYRAAIISLGSVSSEWTFQAMKKYFDHVDHLNIKSIEINLGSHNTEILYDGAPLPRYDCIFAKGSFRYADVLGALKTTINERTYIPITAPAFIIGHDKVLSHIYLQKARIPTPITYLSSSTKTARDILKKINYPIIMKLPCGTQGKGVMVADSYASASSMLDTLESLKQPFLIQEYIDTKGEDIRAIVVGDRVVAAMKRIAGEGEKRANLHAGGRGEPYTVDAYTEKIAVNCAKAIGAEICGVDILISSKGPVVIEANLSPGLQGITLTTNIDIADKIAHYLYNRTKEYIQTELREQYDLNEINIDTVDEEIITKVNISNNTIIFPESVIKSTKFSSKDKVKIKFSDGKLSMDRLDQDDCN